MKIFSDLFNDLCDLIELVNSTFTNQLIIVVMSLLLTDVFAVYGVMREFQAKNDRFFFFLISNTAWAIIQYSIKAFMAHCGQTATSEAEKSVVLVTKAIAAVDRDSNLQNDLNSLLIRMKFREKIFRNVFFTINFQLILTVNSTGNKIQIEDTLFPSFR